VLLASGAERVDLRDACGEMPWPEPGWAIIPGTYPGQSDRVCLPTDQYVVRDQYLQALSDWAKCAEFVGCRQRGGEASPDGCTR
jgi:hypothetical protein